MKKTEYYGLAMQLSDGGDLMCCMVQEGTGNTIETSNLIERWFPYSAIKSVITNPINDENYVTPSQYFKVVVTEWENGISYEFYSQLETPELNTMFQKPDYFADLGDTSFLNG